MKEVLGNKRKVGISGSTLKMIAIITMLIDHTAAVVLLSAMGHVGVEEYEKLFRIYTMMRAIGRVSFPIFCFLLAEGFCHTGDQKKYMGRLFAFAVISEVPFDLAFFEKWFEFSYQNVFFTLFIGVAVMYGFSLLDEIEWDRVLSIVGYVAVLAAGMALAQFLKTDYGAFGVLAIAVFYIFRKRRGEAVLSGGVLFFTFRETVTLLAFIPIALYNGTRGWRLKYVFYVFYPLHLVILYLITIFLDF